MVLVSRRYKFIFVKSKKTAGTSVEGLLEKYCMDHDAISDNKEQNNGKYVPTHKQDFQIHELGIVGSRDHGKNNSNKWKEHMCLGRIANNVNTQVFNNCYKFTIIRNPWDKMVSLYYHEVNRSGYTDLTFDQFIKTSTRSIDFHAYDNPKFDFFIRYENLKEDLQKVATKLKLPDFDVSELPNWKSEYRINKDMHYSKMYTPEQRDKVAKIYAYEIKEFGYTYESPVTQKIQNIEEKILLENQTQ